MKIAMGVRRRDAGTPLTPGGSQQDHVDHEYVRADNAYVARCCLGPCRGPSDCKPRVVVSALENAVFPDDRVGLHWVVVDNASPALHAALSWSFPSLRGVALDTCHLPMKFEAVASHHGSAGSRMLRLVSKFNVSFPSEVCPETWTRLNPFEANGTGSSPVTRCSSTTVCVARHCPRSSQMPQSPA